MGSHVLIRHENGVCIEEKGEKDKQDVISVVRVRNFGVEIYRGLLLYFRYLNCGKLYYVKIYRYNVK